MKKSKSPFAEGEIIECQEGVHQLWFKNTTYNTNIYFLWPCSAAQERQWLLRVMGSEPPSDVDDNYAAWCRQVTATDFDAHIIVMQDKFAMKPKQIGTLVHELGHATENILFDRGMEHTKATCEAFQYLHSSLVERFTSVFVEHKLRERSIKKAKNKTRQ